MCRAERLDSLQTWLHINKTATPSQRTQLNFAFEHHPLGISRAHSLRNVKRDKETATAAMMGRSRANLLISHASSMHPHFTATLTFDFIWMCIAVLMWKRSIEHETSVWLKNCLCAKQVHRTTHLRWNEKIRNNICLRLAALMGYDTSHVHRTVCGYGL